MKVNNGVANLVMMIHSEQDIVSRTLQVLWVMDADGMTVTLAKSGPLCSVKLVAISTQH